MPTSEFDSYDTLYRQIATHSMDVRSRLTAASAADQVVAEVLHRASAMDLAHLASDPRTPASPLRRIARAAVVDLLTTADQRGGEMVGALSALAEALEPAEGMTRGLDARGDVISGTIVLHHTS